MVGSLASYGDGISSALVRATGEVARWVSAQLELSELDQSRARIAEAEVRALRAQISPHFVYNSLTAIASFVRTDPERARELLLEFAEFTRYSFRRHGEFTTLAEELRSIDRYLVLERARFGDRLGVTLRVAPEVLPVAVPFLCLQPLVENAVRHGLEGKEGIGHVTITAEDVGNDARDLHRGRRSGHGPGQAAAGAGPGATGDPADASGGIGIGNVDERLRRSFGPDYGLVVETGGRRRDPGHRTAAEVRGRGARRMTGLRVLAVDDERPGAGRAGLPAPRPAAGRHGSHRIRRRRRSAHPRGRRRRRGLPRHPDAAAVRARPGQDPGPVRRAAASWCSSPRTTSTRWPRSTSRRSTT